LEKGLQAAGLTALQGPIGVLEASSTGSIQNAPLFKLPSPPPMHELQLRHQDVLGIGIGVGLGVPFAAAVAFGAYKFATRAPSAPAKAAEEAPANAEEAPAP
jgi:H+/gluconate symporter-like permease